MTDARIVLVRHGQTEWSLSGQHTGSTDIPLTAVGEEQALAAGEALRARFDLVLTSPRRRAVHTAELAGFPAAIVDDNLAEWDYGAYEGLTSDEIVEQAGHPWVIWRDGVPSGNTPGEQPAEVGRRAEAAVARLRECIDSGGRALVFSHSHFLRVLTAIWLGEPVQAGAFFALDTGSISTLGLEHGRDVVTSWNYVPHDANGPVGEA